MRDPAFTGQFRRDYKRARKRGSDVDHLNRVIHLLIAGQTLPARCSCHPLRGGYVGHWECHLEPDLLLIWYLSGDDDIVFVRAGSHADLFG